MISTQKNSSSQAALGRRYLVAFGLIGVVLGGWLMYQATNGPGGAESIISGAALIAGGLWMIWRGRRVTPPRR